MPRRGFGPDTVLQIASYNHVGAALRLYHTILAVSLAPGSFSVQDFFTLIDQDVTAAKPLPWKQASGPDAASTALNQQYMWKKSWMGGGGGCWQPCLRACQRHHDDGQKTTSMIHCRSTSWPVALQQALQPCHFAQQVPNAQAISQGEGH